MLPCGQDERRSAARNHGDRPLRGRRYPAGRAVRAVGWLQALYDREAAHRHTLKNLLQREGYEDLEAVRVTERVAGRLAEARSALRRVLARRKLALSPDDDARIESATDLADLERWLDQAVDAPTAQAALA